MTGRACAEMSKCATENAASLGGNNPTHRKRISKYCTISCGIKHPNPFYYLFRFVNNIFLPNWEQKIDGHPDYKKIQGCQKSEQKLDTKETCYGDVTRTANERPVFKSRDYLRPMRGRFCGDTESWHRVIRHGRNINVIIIIKKVCNITFPSLFSSLYQLKTLSWRALTHFLHFEE